MDRIKRLRWQQRSLPEDTKQNLSQSEIEVRCFSAKLQNLKETETQAGGRVGSWKPARRFINGPHSKRTGLADERNRTVKKLK